MLGTCECHVALVTENTSYATVIVTQKAPTLPRNDI